MLPEDSDGCLGTASHFMASEVKNGRLFDLWEDCKRVFGLEVRIDRQCVLTIHRIIRVVESCVDALEGSLSLDYIVVGGLSRPKSLLVLAP